MFSIVEWESLQVGHRYFISYGEWLYFGTIISYNDKSVIVICAVVNVYKGKFYSGRFDGMQVLKTSNYTFNYTFYRYIPYKMEEIMLNKILKQLLGEYTFYSLNNRASIVV